ncbi:UNVERIFIED_CONTAM: hypothetical protein GTU68_005003 [Idotea baltica]|nr:hypothetical protein [Idotea baltica]
MWITKTQISF